MQYFLKKSNSNSITVIFLGWACDFNQFAPLISERYANTHDILYVWDYRDINFNFNLSEYDEVRLIAFSYGVFAAACTEPKLFGNVKYSAAINGTPKPIDKEFGINPRMFDLTLKSLTKDTLTKFYKNMFDNDEDYSKFVLTQNKITDEYVEQLKSELLSIKHLAGKLNTPKFQFNSAFISKNDKIFPTKTQTAYWERKVETQYLDGGHFPFYTVSPENFIND